MDFGFSRLFQTYSTSILPATVLIDLSGVVSSLAPDHHGHVVPNSSAYMLSSGILQIFDLQYDRCLENEPEHISKDFSWEPPWPYCCWLMQIHAHTSQYCLNVRSLGFINQTATSFVAYIPLILFSYQNSIAQKMMKWIVVKSVIIFFIRMWNENTLNNSPGSKPWRSNRIASSRPPRPPHRSACCESHSAVGHRSSHSRGSAQDLCIINPLE